MRNIALLLLAIVLVLAMNTRPIEAGRVLTEDVDRVLLSTMQRGSDTPSTPNLPVSPDLPSTLQRGSDTPSTPNLPVSPNSPSTLQRGSDTPSAPNLPTSPLSSTNPTGFTAYAGPPPRP
ncbi:hypothetical protein TIFTF001_023476 [Ficus carica]|uniref:Uncharacterized protein n=1 Tax=Ficus carica TaxID=3494 RepID=A0AA88AL06_FICCA|nr:hypothetical protein TIFTF001_023476 [Ficus carica]